MKIILSRKGFDSSSGGCPNPILPDGRLVTLPIPDPYSSISYEEISLAGLDAGMLVSDLTNGRLNGSDGAHLDPDLQAQSLKREPGWRPIFGQRGAAQGHLRNHRVCTGDLFLFYGLFREAETEGSRYCWKKSSTARHIIWGWLQADDILEVTPALADDFDWMSYHPHLNRPQEKNNVIYLSMSSLQLPGHEGGAIPGSGVFTRLKPSLVLSGEQQDSTASIWELPAWFYPRKGIFPLSYHQRNERWMRSGTKTLLKSATRGQEFILNTAHFPEAIGWVKALLHSSS